jgi:8-oxo-dGTP pyrophosphatase MutT (NUDIX family)
MNEENTQEYRQRVEVLVYKINSDYDIKFFIGFQRSYNGAYHPLFPGGGVEDQDSLIETAIKETLQETNIKLYRNSISPITNVDNFTIDFNDLYSERKPPKRLLDRVAQYKGTNTVYYSGKFQMFIKDNVNQEHDNFNGSWYTYNEAINIFKEYIKENEANNHTIVATKRLEVLKKFRLE